MTRSLLLCSCVLVVLKVSGSAGQLLDIIQDNIYQDSSPVQECNHDVAIPAINFDEDYDYKKCKKEVAKSRHRRHPDQDKRTDEVILKYGFSLVTYNNVTTKDGYMLTIFRITGNSKSPPKPGKPAVLLFHGAGTASDMWVLQSNPQNNLPFLLANAGWDVFLANARGTDFSMGHLRLNPATDLSYWDFSFSEIAVHDLPVILDLMIQETENEKIFFIGHSYAASIYAAALSEMPELNEKFHASYLLSPAVFLGHAYHPARFFSGLLEFGPRVPRLLNSMLRGRIGGSVPALDHFFQSRFCNPTALRCGLCENLFFYLYGYDASQIDSSTIPNCLSKASNTQSVKNFFHLAQNFRTCEFRKFDYGLKANLKRYGQTQPPSYDLANLHAPIHIYYADSDNMVPPVDAATFRDNLPVSTVKTFNRVNWTNFNHIDFAVAKSANALLYNNIISSMNNYWKSF